MDGFSSPLRTTAAPPGARPCGDTHGFAVVIEASEEALRTAVRGAWKDAGASDDPLDQGGIPASMTLAPGIVCGGYTVAGGRVSIPQDELNACFWPAGNGIELKLGLHTQLALMHPPVPSAEQFDLHVDVRARIPLEAGGVNHQQLILRLEDVARADVRATLTSGDPLLPRFDALLTEFVARAFEAPDPSEAGVTLSGFPYVGRTFGPLELSWPLGLITIAVRAEGSISDNQERPPHAIAASHCGDTVIIAVPIHLRIAHLRPDIVAQALNLPDPMGVTTRMLITVPFETMPGSYVARLSRATVAVGELSPTGGQEGANYEHNRWRLPLLEALIQSQLKEHGECVAQSLGDISIEFPTVAEIEALIGDIAHQKLVAYGQLAVWTPEATMPGFSVTDLTVRVLPHVLAIGLNAGEEPSLAALGNFIPAGHQFAVAISEGCLQEVIAHTRIAYGFGEPDLPKRLTVHGRQMDIQALDVCAAPPTLRMQAVGTVVDTFLGLLRVGARARADIGLSWEPHSTIGEHTGQAIVPIVQGTPTVALKLSALCWAIAAVLALIAFGTLRLVDNLVVVSGMLTIWVMGARLAQELVASTIAGVLRDMAPWPSHLTRVGQACAVFSNPIVVDRSGMILAGDFALRPPDPLTTARER
jgi:hypothetical protein